jgi:hypothetical protein
MDGETADILGFDFVLVPFAEVRTVQLPCVYLMAHRDPGGGDLHRIHYAGQTKNLAERFAGHHQLAAAISAGATHALALWVEQLHDRLHLETLLRYHYRPPLNAEQAPSHAQGWGAAIGCNRPLLAAAARRAQISDARFAASSAFAEPPLSRRR